jgi:DnaA family protein
MSTPIPQQLLLGFRLDDAATLAGFVSGQTNRQLLQHLRQQVLPAGEQFSFLWGRPGVGKTHLLQALCHELARSGGSPIYVPLTELEQIAPEMLEGLEQLDLVCLDDLDAVTGNSRWEQALFNFYNRARDQAVRFVVSASRPPAELPLGLADLRSRLQSAVVFQVHELTEGEKAELLRVRAGLTGISLSDQVITYILQRHDRSATALVELLRRLDQLSLEQQRQITVPLVRQLMEH